MAINWSGQNTGGTTAMQQYGAGGYGNTAGWGQSFQQPTGTTQFWRPPSGGSTGLSNIGGSQIGLSRPQMSPAPPVYPQMSSAYPTSKGGTPLYNRDVQQQEQDWINQNSGTQWQSGEGATVPYPQMHNGGGNTTSNGITYNAQGQQLDSNGNVAYGDWGSNNNGGGGGGQPGQYNTSMNGPTSGPGVGLTPGAPGHQGSQQDYYDPVTGQMIYGNEQATGWVPPAPTPTGQTSGEGGTPPQYMGPNWQMPFNAQQYLAMNPQQQQTANNWMANWMQGTQGQQNAYQYEQDRAQAALQYAQQHGLNVMQFMAQQGISEQQLKMAQEAQQFNQQNTQAYQNMDYSNMYHNQNMNTRQQDWAEKQGLWGQQNWGADYAMRQNQMGHQQGMDYKQFGEGVRQFDVGQGNWQSQFGEGQRQFNQQFGLQQRGQEQQYGLDMRRLASDTEQWQGAQGIQRQGQLNELDMFGRNLGENQRQFNVGQMNEMAQFGQQLDFEKEKNKQQYGLAVDNFQLNKMVQTGELKLSQDKLAQQQFEFGEQMNFEQQKNAQQFGLAVSNQELDWLVQTGQLDLQRQQFGQGQYEFGAEMGQRSYEFDAQQRQQMAIEQARLAQAEKAANVAAVGRTLAPSAKWLRAA
jgi:hypothetical protein